jgi:prepilin-type N-terminal cleavage/methylation domain-containing protein/prepilin-type processing-associated H-X9-DG protein
MTHANSTDPAVRQGLRAALTLIEMLLVIAIIAVLLALLLPAIQRVREAAARTVCQSNLRQIGMAALNYESVYHGLPPRCNVTPPYSGWGTNLLPFIEQDDLAAEYHFDANFYDPINRPVIGEHLSIFSCPSAPPGRTIDIVDPYGNLTGSIGAVGDYFAPNSVDAYWWPEPQRSLAADEMQSPAMAQDVPRPLSAILDGLSNTLLVSELAGRPEYWILGVKQPADTERLPFWWGPWASYNSCIYKTWSADGTTPGGPCTINCNNSWGIYSFHRTGANAVFVDGSVHYLPVGLDRNIFAGLVTRAGGEGLNIDF